MQDLKGLRIETDDQSLDEALRALAVTVLEYGGGFLSGVKAKGVQGDLTIERAVAARRKERLMYVPETCLPDVSKFDVTLDQGQFVAKPKDEVETSSQSCHDAFMRMIDVYNVSGKAASWQRASPWLTLRHDQYLLFHLLGDVKNTSQFRLFEGGKFKQVLVNTFLSSRVYNLKVKVARTGNTRAVSVLMPFIDFLNHDFRARPYQLVPTNPELGNRKLYTFQDRPVKDRYECFVRYNVIDSHKALMHYGFLDDSAPFAMSRPIELDVGHGLTLRVQGAAGAGYIAKLPEGLKDLRLFMPRVHSPSNDEVSLSRLMIPGGAAPYAMRRVLRAVIRSKRAKLTNQELDAAVHRVEREVLESNHRYYDRAAELRARAKFRVDPPAVPGRTEMLETVGQLIDQRKQWLYDYAGRLAL